MNIVKEMISYGPYIRFELGLEDLSDEAYRCESLRRAKAIYRSIFKPTDDVIFIHRTSYGKNEKRVDRIRLKRFFKTRLRKVRLNLQPYEFDESDDECYTIEWTVEVKAQEIRMPYVLESIVNSDFKRKPNANGRIYLHNKTKVTEGGILFHMYDDRGCDVYTSDKSALLPLYHLHRQWILDYNRYQVDHILGEGLAGIFETAEEQKNRWETNRRKISASEINLQRVNTCHISHYFHIPTSLADNFEKEISFTSFTIQRGSVKDDRVTFVAAKTQALALIDYQTLLMSMYGKKYGTYEGWSFEQA